MRPVAFCAGISRAAFLLVLLFSVGMLSACSVYAQADEPNTPEPGTVEQEQESAPPVVPQEDTPTPQSSEPPTGEAGDDAVRELDKNKSNFNAQFTVTPIVANEKAKPRDIIKKELLITNNTSGRLDLYISVQNVDPTQGGQEIVSPGVADLSQSLANWIEVTRGVIELAPNESRKIPYLIHVNVTAKPGSYFARILFNAGSRRSEGEPFAGEDGTSLLLNVEVEDDAKERLQLGTFRSDSSVVLGESVGFSYLLENIGNRTLEPRGAIRIFNRRGEEVGSVPLNAEGVEITPENKEQLATLWSAAGRFGKYKAFLDLEYGDNQLASVQDTVYFWVFPWKEILASLVGVLVLAVLGTYVVHMRTVARPVHAHVARQPGPEPHVAYAHTASVMMPSNRERAVAPLAPTGGKTVVLSRSRASRDSVQEHHDQAVAPVRAALQDPPVTHGNVVQLSSRRRSR